MMTIVMWVMVEMLMMPREVSMMVMVMILMPGFIPVIVPPARCCHRYCQQS
ncbi:unnamed protein product [Brugia pahangi]|uniref:Secreted protein n=1 Tax=Brugia pahangi TaxID=6280 RepID=A0A0N4T8Q9_BRUPA|nr:unnamed protein product [Brugia pahangi]